MNKLQTWYYYCHYALKSAKKWFRIRFWRWATSNETKSKDFKIIQDDHVPTKTYWTGRRKIEFRKSPSPLTFTQFNTLILDFNSFNSKLGNIFHLETHNHFETLHITRNNFETILNSETILLLLTWKHIITSKHYS